MKQNEYYNKFISQLCNVDFINIIIIALLWIIAIVLVNPVGNFPLNDDWAYAESVKHLLETGDFQLPGWAVANLLPQVLFGALFCLPFGFSFTALRFSTLTLGLIGVIATYGLLKEIGSHQKIALIGASLVAINPVYFVVSNTFMTDVPHYAVTVLSLYFFCIGIRKNSLTAILVAVFIAIISLLIRQVTVTLFCGYAIAYIIKNKAKIRSFITAALLFVLLPAGIQSLFSHTFWPKSYGNYGVKEQEVVSQLAYVDIKASASFIYFALCAFLYIGCFLFPFLIVIFASKLKWMRSHSRKILVSFLLFLVTPIGVWLFLKQEKMPIRGNVINDWGLGPLTLRDTLLLQESVPNYIDFFWLVVTIFAMIGAGLLLLFLFLSIVQLFTKEVSLNRRSLILLNNSTAFIYFLPLGLGFFFDRYLLLLLPLSMVMVLTSVRDLSDFKFSLKTGFLTWLTILTIGIFTIGATHDYLSWNRIRWQALEYLMQEEQISPNRIDGGFEFNGWYLYNSDYSIYKKRKAKTVWWWVEEDDYVVAFSPLAGYKVVKQYFWENWLPFKSNRILILQKN